MSEVKGTSLNPFDLPLTLVVALWLANRRERHLATKKAWMARPRADLLAYQVYIALYAAKFGTGPHWTSRLVFRLCVWWTERIDRALKQYEYKGFPMVACGFIPAEKDDEHASLH